MKAQPNVDAAKARHAELVDEFNLAKSEFDRGTATGATWPVLASLGLERWAEKLAFAGTCLMYAERNGALFDERRIALEAARAQLTVAARAQSKGSPDPKVAASLEQAVVVARALLFHVAGSFPIIMGKDACAGPRNDIDWYEKRGERATVMLDRAVSCLNGIERDRHRQHALELFGKLRAEATPTRKARLEPFGKFAEVIVQEVANDKHVREAYALVALLEVGLYRREHEGHDPDDRDRDASRKGSPMVDPPTPEELAKHFAKFFAHNEHHDAVKVANATEMQKRVKADAAKRDAETAKRWAYISQSKVQMSTAFMTVDELAAQAFDEAKHTASAPPAPAPPPVALPQKRSV